MAAFVLLAVKLKLPINYWLTRAYACRRGFIYTFLRV
jgi:hypothetical protein